MNITDLLFFKIIDPNKKEKQIITIENHAHFL